ncbi:membrane protein [Photobacterium aquae]|uniref:Membrane protein n=1 Tax=Photobacterium aquae TaxID=1195763 RepID=A0A0J1HB33_9GAMM|nr:hypothetical protein [Photobacterium aquae]KLV08863.1 membrane protein [Photobacterium aquae]
MDVVTTFLIPALLGAQLVLSLVLTKGEICPGQRGRVHKTLPVLLVGWAISLMITPAALLPLAALGYFTLKVKTGKTRDAGPLRVFYLAIGLAVVALVASLQGETLPKIGMSLVAVVMFGALIAHLLLTQARTRLQAFHRLLPFAGFAGAMLSALCVLWLASGMDPESLTVATKHVVAALMLLVVGVLVWAMHLLTGKAVNRWQLLAAAVLLIGSAQLQTVLF